MKLNPLKRKEVTEDAIRVAVREAIEVVKIRLRDVFPELAQKAVDYQIGALAKEIGATGKTRRFGRCREDQRESRHRGRRRAFWVPAFGGNEVGVSRLNWAVVWCLFTAICSAQWFTHGYPTLGAVCAVGSALFYHDACRFLDAAKENPNETP
jgi:hypothetical protein